MSGPRPGNSSERVNDRLQDYAAFPDILSLLRGVPDKPRQPSSGSMATPTVPLDAWTPTAAEGDDRRAALDALAGDPDLAELADRARQIEEQRRARVHGLFWPDPPDDGSEQRS
jgi:hypothetical protein